MSKQNKIRGWTRRRVLQGATAAAAGVVIGGSSKLISSFALPQYNPVPGSANPPNCPGLPYGGTQFVPGSDTRPIVPRKPVSALSATEITELQTAFNKLRALPQGDPRTWYMQADIHALLCDSCNGVSMQIHNSWNFLPWHRAYLYFYERILGSLAMNINTFRIPFWDWENNRSIPLPYLAPTPGGLALYDTSRDPAMAAGGDLPPTDGSMARIMNLMGISDFPIFGGTSTIGGSLEQDPHNVIHDDLGNPTNSYEDMGVLGYAARDPIFFAHHCNIDKIWWEWNTNFPPSPSGGYANPSDPAFLGAQWSFYDEHANVVSITAQDVLNFPANLRYTYPQGPQIPPLFDVIIPCELVCCAPGPNPGPYLKVSQEASEQILTQSRASRTVVLVLTGVEIPEGIVGTFNVMVVRGEHRTAIGTLTVLGNTLHDKTPKLANLVLDITKAASDLFAKQNPASIRLSPRNPGRARAKPFLVRAQSAEIRMARQTGD